MTATARKKVILSFVGVPLIAGLFWIQMNQPADYPTAKGADQDSLSVDPNDTLISIVAVGDMMLGTNFPDTSYLPKDHANILLPLEALLKNADITFGNLEGTVLNNGGEVKRCSDPKSCYAFRQSEYLVDYLKNAGFDFLSLANNHMGDFGATGRQNTQRILSEKGIKRAGLLTCQSDTLHVKGLIIGFTAFAPNSGCLQLNEYAEAKRIVMELNEQCDVVIVSFHGGAEGSSRQHVPREHELFLGEDRGNVYEFARVMIDAGADVILGHGPHVTRAIDCYKGKFITYSMGNFATYGRFNLSGPSGIAPIYKLYVTRSGNFVKGTIISTQQLGAGGPILDPANRVLQVITELTTQDFPETKWTFGADGSFQLAR
jgi:poly-gamma-glutamate capsule biosynthesis protein CapA/YwtB (metallophosphatase superfamily)